MGKKRQVNGLFKAEMQGRRPVGRPRTRWKDVLLRDLKRIGLRLEPATTEALDRDRWRAFVQDSCDYNAARS